MVEKVKEETPVEGHTLKLNRRELLNYAWIASMVLFAGELGVLAYLYALPRFRPGEFGGAFTVDVAEVLPLGAGPADNPNGRFWLSNTENGVLALYKVCTHLGCLYKWVETRTPFECPCHGSKFEIDGTYIEGPAPRSLDRFATAALDADGNELARSEDGSPLELSADTANIRVDTGERILGERV